MNDLCGALGTPARIAHTIIVGEPEKAKLIESILSFLSYFLRSGLIENREETRDPSQDDVQEAISIIERAVRKNPSLEHPSSSWTHSSLSKRNSKSSLRRLKHHDMTGDDSEGFYSLKKSKSYEEPRKNLKFELGDGCSDSSKMTKVEYEPSVVQEIQKPANLEETSSKKLKRSTTLQKSLNEISTSTSNREVSEKKESLEEQTTSKVKIIVSDEDEQNIVKESTSLAVPDKLNKNKKTGDETEEKLTELRRRKLSGLKRFDWTSKTL